MARALTAAVAGARLLRVRARESVVCRLVFHSAPPSDLRSNGLLQVRGRGLARSRRVVGQHVEEGGPGSVVPRREGRDAAVCSIDREDAPVEGEAVAEGGDDLARDRDDPDRGIVVRGWRFVRTRIAARQVLTPRHQLRFDPVDPPYLRGELYHGAGGEGLLDADGD